MIPYLKKIVTDIFDRRKAQNINLNIAQRSIAIQNISSNITKSNFMVLLSLLKDEMPEIRTLAWSALKTTEFKAEYDDIFQDFVKSTLLDHPLKLPLSEKICEIAFEDGELEKIVSWLEVQDRKEVIRISRNFLESDSIKIIISASNILQQLDQEWASHQNNDAYSELKKITQKINKASIAPCFEFPSAGLNLITKINRNKVKWSMVDDVALVRLYEKVLKIKDLDYDVQVKDVYKTKTETYICYGCAHGDMCCEPDKCRETYSYEVLDYQKIELVT